MASVRFTVKWKNLDRFRATMRRAPKDLRDILDLQIREVMEQRQRLSKRLAPVRTGRLRAGIRVRKRVRYVYELGVSGREVPYAFYQHEGTRYIRPRRFISRALIGVRKEIQRVIRKWGDVIKRKHGWR